MYPASTDQSYDTTYAGFGNGKKYPQGKLYTYLLEQYEHTKQPKLLSMVTNTLDRMHADEFLLNADKPIAQRNFKGLYDPVAHTFIIYPGPHGFMIKLAGPAEKDAINKEHAELIQRLYKYNSKLFLMGVTKK